MSTDTKEYRRIIPLEPGVTDEQKNELRWYVRESFEVEATVRGLQIVEYSDSVVPPSDIEASKVLTKQLKHPVKYYEWHLFRAVAQRVESEPLSEVCGYCAHPPHAAGECGQPVDEWRLALGVTVVINPARAGLCPCATAAGVR